jgi:hypothetical protein
MLSVSAAPASAAPRLYFRAKVGSKFRVFEAER